MGWKKFKMLLGEKTLKEIIGNKKVLFITTKNIDYIRNNQEIGIIRENAKSVEMIYSQQKNYFFRVLDVWYQMKKNVIKRQDIIFIGFAPQLIIPFVGYKLKKSTIIIDFFISVYDTLICDRKKFKENGAISRLCHFVDEITLKKADYIVTDTRAHAEYFVKEFNANPNIMETIYLKADAEIYYPRIQRKNPILANKFVVLYFGSILPLQGVDVVLEAVKLLKEKQGIFFDIIGPISDKYEKPVSSNVCYTEWLSQKDLSNRIANADICLAGHFSGNIKKAKRTIPGKAYIYEMMNKPMILGNGEANHELFQEDEKHYFVEMGSGKALSEKILEIYYNEKDNKRI